MLNNEKKNPIIVGILNIESIKQMVLPILLALYKLTAMHIHNNPTIRNILMRNLLLSIKNIGDVAMTPKAHSAIPAARTDLGGVKGCTINLAIIYIDNIYINIMSMKSIRFFLLLIEGSHIIKNTITYTHRIIYQSSSCCCHLYS